MNKRFNRAVGFTLLFAVGGLTLPGCDLEVLNPGAILDEDLNTPDLMPVVVAGVAAEFNDVMDNHAFDVARLSDDLAGTGSYFDTGKFRRGEYDNEDSEGHWEQTHEAAWAAGEAWSRLTGVLEGAANSDPGAARTFLIQGLAHRVLGESFCEVVYDIGGIQPRTAAFDSAIVAFNQAVQIGTAAGASDFVTAANAGIAQANVGLGNWSAAVAAAAKVPTSFEYSAIYHPTANSNVVWDESHGRAETGLWATPALAFGDPRTPYTVCGTWKDGGDPPDATKGVTKTGNCTGSGSGAHQGADGLTAHYRQDKYPEDGSDVPVVKGTEMRLIEAEDALIRGDLGKFTTKINEVRAFYGIDPIAQPASAGALEWIQGPLNGANKANAEDDAWSILDRERYLTLWLEGRRLWDLDRWDHPFLNGGGLIGPGEPRRLSCMPIPEIECTLNPAIQNSSSCT